MKNFSTIAEPLWALTRASTPWKGCPNEQTYFNQLKEAISTHCMAYFNKDWNTVVEVDASPVGLGSVITQINPRDKNDKHIVSFASRLLSDVERRYSQCEKEASAAVWGCESYNEYNDQYSIMVNYSTIAIDISNA